MQEDKSGNQRQKSFRSLFNNVKVHPQLFRQSNAGAMLVVGGKTVKKLSDNADGTECCNRPGCRIHLKKRLNQMFGIFNSQKNNQSEEKQQKSAGNDFLAERIIGVKEKARFKRGGVMAGQPVLDSHFAQKGSDAETDKNGKVDSRAAVVHKSAGVENIGQQQRDISQIRDNFQRAAVFVEQAGKVVIFENKDTAHPQ